MDDKNDYLMYIGYRVKDIRTRLDDFILYVESEKKRKEISDDKICIILYSKKDLHNSKNVKYIYRTLEDLIEKFTNDVNDIDETYSIFLQMWIFD